MSDADPAPAGPFPAPPREPLWRSCLAARWPLGLLGGLVLTLGLAVQAFGAATGRLGLPFADAVLDSGAAETGGRLLATEAWRGGQTRLHFRYRDPRAIPGTDTNTNTNTNTNTGTDTGLGNIEGHSFLPPGTLPPPAGTDLRVEFVPGRPTVSRVVGTTIAPDVPALSRTVYTSLLLGVVALFLWLRRALQLRITLREGAVAQAQVIEAPRVSGVYPPMLALHFRWMTDAGQEYIEQHWVPARSPLGQMLRADAPRYVTAVYDPARPQLCRAVTAADFVGARS